VFPAWVETVLVFLTLVDGDSPRVSSLGGDSPRVSSLGGDSPRVSCLGGDSPLVSYLSGGRSTSCLMATVCVSPSSLSSVRELPSKS
jgi:hypothetical protein